MLLSTLFACSGQPDIETKDSDNPADTAETGDTEDTADTEETGETGETGDTEDTGDTTIASSPLTFVPEGDFDGVTVGLFPIIDFESFDVYDPTATSALTASTTVDAPRPVEELLLDVTEVPGMRASYAVIGAWEDDGDERQESGESFVSASRLALWLEGPIPTAYTDLGLRVGWNVLLLEEMLTTGEPVILDPDAVALPLLEWRMEANFGGTFYGDPDGVSVVAAPATLGVGVYPATYLADGPLVGTSWSASFSGAPPADHYTDVDGDGDTEGVEFFLAYEDTAPPEGFGVGDVTGSPACSEEGLALAYFLEDFDVLQNAVIYEASDLRPGWSVVAATDKGGVTLDESLWTALDFTVDCTF